MGQEFIIKSQNLEDKINQLLPSQGGYQAGVDLSASTTVIPIVDLTETAEGSLLRQDLQTSLSKTSVTTFNVFNSTVTVVNTTGYYRVFGTAVIDGTGNCRWEITDGIVTKVLKKFDNVVNLEYSSSYDFTVFLEAGDSLQGVSTNSNARLDGCTRQVADISGNLVNP